VLVLSTSRLFLNDRLRFRDFLVRMWLPWDFEYTIFPEPVFLNRLAAPRLVLIFGIVINSFAQDTHISTVFYKKLMARAVANLRSRHYEILLKIPFRQIRVSDSTL